eukprot:8174863-Alexandrium_andersonii.AAC.1
MLGSLRFKQLRKKKCLRCILHPSEASWSVFEAVPVPLQVKIRTPGAVFHFPKLLEHESPEN